MPVQRLHTTPRFSEVTISGQLVHLAGQLAEDTRLDIQGQTRQTLELIDKSYWLRQVQTNLILCQYLYFSKILSRIMLP